VLFFLSLAAIPISLADIKSFKIPNIYLWLLFLGLAPFIAVHGLGSISQLLSSFLIVFILHLCGMGMGDVKLLCLIVLAFNSDRQFSSLTFFSYLLGVATIHLLILALKDHMMVRKLPLAPSIFVGLALYLATR
jgi:Flp pilus assembly protein protease CpaA